MVGSMVHVIIHIDRIETMTNGLCDPGDVESPLAQMIAFVAGGMRSGSPRDATLPASSAATPPATPIGPGKESE